MQLTQEQLEAITAALTGTTIGANGKAKPAVRNSANKVNRVGVTASDVKAPVKAVKAEDVEYPEDSELAVHDGKQIAIHTDRSEYNGNVTYHIAFGGFRTAKRTKNGGMVMVDFALTLNQARMLANPDVQAALSAYMEKIPE